MAPRSAKGKGVAVTNLMEAAPTPALSLEPPLPLVPSASVDSSASRSIGSKDALSTEQTVSRSLGSTDSFSVGEVQREVVGFRRNNGKQIWVPKQSAPQSQSPFNNHRELEGDDCLLSGSMAERGKVKLAQEDWIEPEEDRKFPLFGRFAGKFPGMRAVDELAKSWGVWYRLDEHLNGHVMFWFKCKEDRNEVLAGGPYAIFGKRLFIQSPPETFTEDYSDYRFLPVWIRMPRLPKPCWNAGALSKIAGGIGEPIFMDRFTKEKKKMAFARILVDVDCSLKPIDHVTIELHDGTKIDQKLIYENLFAFCTRCGGGKHVTNNCPLSRVEANLRARAEKDGIDGEQGVITVTPETTPVIGGDAAVFTASLGKDMQKQAAESSKTVKSRELPPFGTQLTENGLVLAPLETVNCSHTDKIVDCRVLVVESAEQIEVIAGNETVQQVGLNGEAETVHGEQTIDREERVGKQGVDIVCGTAAATVEKSCTVKKKAKKVKKAVESALNPSPLENAEIEPLEEFVACSTPSKEPSRVVGGARKKSPRSRKNKKGNQNTLSLGVNKVTGGGGRQAPTLSSQC